MALNKDEIVQGLRRLGVTEGSVVMAHVSLSAFGEVEGGADTVIAALLEAVGETGTLCMPAMASAQPFDVHTSPSVVGQVTERFRHWPGVKRGLHPTHSVCCLGPRAEELLAGHIDQPTALGPESPWGRLARIPGALVLLLGCDQDRNTLLHCAEEAVDAPYLGTIERDYLDETGQVRTKVLTRFPGPHRNFIGLDRLFREQGAMRVGRIGSAVCRAIDAGRTVELAIAALRADPAAVLCDNPHCEDCVKQRADITRHRLRQETFTLAAVVDEIGWPLERLEEAVEVLQNQGIDTVELGPRLSAAVEALSPDELAAVARRLGTLGARASLVTCSESDDLTGAVQRTARAARALAVGMVKLPPMGRGTPPDPAVLASLADELGAQGIKLVVENAAGTVCDTKAGCEAFLDRVPGLWLAFNPAHFAHAGEKPFLQTFYKGKLKRRVAQLYVTDGCRPGGPQYTLPARGQGEVKELVSILRCRSFDGVLCLKMGTDGGPAEFVRQCEAFWHMMDGL